MSNIKTAYELGEIAAQLGRSAFENPYFSETVEPEHVAPFMKKFGEWADGWLTTHKKGIAANKARDEAWHEWNMKLKP